MTGIEWREYAGVLERVIAARGGAVVNGNTFTLIRIEPGRWIARRAFGEAVQDVAIVPMAMGADGAPTLVGVLHSFRQAGIELHPEEVESMQLIYPREGRDLSREACLVAFSDRGGRARHKQLDAEALRD